MRSLKVCAIALLFGANIAGSAHAGYVMNDPLNKTDPTGTYTCGSSLSESQCQSFTAAQDKAIATHESANKAIGSLLTELKGGKELSSSAAATANTISTALGHNAGESSKAVSQLLAASEKMLGTLKGDIPVEFAQNDTAYARTFAGEKMTVGPSFFAFGNASDRARIVSHESHHESMGSPGDGWVYIGGAANRGLPPVWSGSAAGAQQLGQYLGPQQLIPRFPESVVSALGFKRLP